MVLGIATAGGCAPLPAKTESPSPSASLSSPPVVTPSPSPTVTAPTPTVAPSPTAPPFSSIEVSVITADVVDDALEVTGIVLGSADSRGRCTLTVTQGDVTRTTDGTVTPNAGNAYCPLLSVPVAALRSGSSEVTLSYAGAEGSAVSTPVTVVVP